MKDLPDFTNRRKVIPESPDGSIKSNRERKLENEEEFESICSRIKECSVSNKQPLPQKTAVNSASSSCSSSSLTSRHTFQAVKEFQKYLEEHGGHYGGWKEKDHLFFIKIRNKFPLSKTAEMVNENFPDITIDKIISHDNWYNEYLRLKSANKKAIEQWKKTQKPSPKAKEEPKPDPSLKQPTFKRDPNVKEKIEIWKAHTLAEKLERIEQHRQEEMRKKKEEEQRKKRQEEKRVVVNRYREDKLSYEMAMKTAAEASKLQAKKEAARQTEILLKYFRYEDRRYTERQRAVRLKPPKMELTVKSCVEAKRDPNRLLRPTRGWLEHLRANRSEEHNCEKQSLYIHHLKKLGKPVWRKPISA